jgi:Rieske Fe-S protein
LLKENAEVGLHFVGDRLKHCGTRPIEDLAPGEGDIVSVEGEKVAGYRDEDGNLMAVSTRCTHLGCQVNWNVAERSWDCPCHGSRFAPSGEVLHGPAVHRLERKPLG